MAGPERGRSAAAAWLRILGGLILAAVLGPLWGAVPGLPQPAAPLPTPILYVDTGNDSLSDEVENRDDFRTGTLDAGYLGHHLAFAANTSILTNRAAMARLDQVTATGGYAWTPASSPGSYLSTGLGMRAWGDFGGQHVQDAVHSGLGYQELDYPYDPAKRFDALAYVAGRWVYLVPTPGFASWLGPPGRWGAMLSAGGLISNHRDEEGEVELDGLYAGRQGAFWLGGRYHDEGGTLPSATAVAVADHERGFWVTGGMSIQPWQRAAIVLDAGIDPHTEGAFGRLGVACCAPSRAPSRQSEAVEVDLGSYSASVFAVQVRWRPIHLLPPGPPWLQRWLRSELFLDYRFGNVPHQELPAATIDTDQLLAGISETLTPPALFGVLRIAPYGDAGGGVRIERIEPTEAQSQVPAQQATRPVVQLGCGLRLNTTLSRTPDHLLVIDRFRIGAGYDRWFPIESATASAPYAGVRYQVPDWSLGGYVGFLLDW